MNKVIRRFKKIMGFGKESKPILKEGEEELKEEAVKPKLKSTKVKAVKEVVEEVEETEIEKLERELEELKEEEASQEEIVEQPEEKNSPTLTEVLHSHEQRILQMEAKWFRLGGI